MKEENKIALNYCRMRMWERKRDCCARLWDCGLISGTRASVAAMRTRLRTHTQKLKTFISLFSRWWVSALFILSLSLALLSTLNTHKKFRLPCEGKVSVRWSPVLLLLFFFFLFSFLFGWSCSPVKWPLLTCVAHYFHPSHQAYTWVRAHIHVYTENGVF